MAGETIMSIAYGIDIQQKDDPYVKAAQEGVHPLTAATVPGAFLVDMMPVLKYVPEWVPGAGFQKKAKEWAKLAMTMVDMPFEACKKSIVRNLFQSIRCDANKITVFKATGKAPPSFVAHGLQKIQEGTNDEAYQEDIIRGSAGTLYAGERRPNSF